MKRWRWTGVALAVIVAGMLALPFLIPAERLRGTAEAELAAALGQPVRLGSISWSLLPAPRLVVTQLGIGPAPGLELGAADLRLALAPLLGGAVEISSLVVRGATLPLEQLRALAGSGSGGGPRVRLARLEASDVTLVLPDGETLGPWRLEARFGADGKPLQATLTDGERARLTAEPADAAGAYTLRLRADDWRLPFARAPLRFDRLEAEAVLAGAVLEVARLGGEAYGGRVTGTARLDWTRGWSLEGRAQPADLRLGPLLAEFGQHTLEGRLRGDFTFSGTAARPAELPAALTVAGDFLITDGILHEADLERASQTFTREGLTGGQTRFDTLGGHLRLERRDLRLTGLKVASSALEAGGDVRVDPARNLSGEVEVGLRRTTALASIPLRVSGTVAEPRLRITEEALAGAAAGTAVMGPGLGTAVGIKAGKILKGVGRLLGGGGEEREAK